MKQAFRFPLLLLLTLPALAGEPTAENIAQAVADPDRSVEDRKRDVFRKPAEVLTFFGLKPNWRVVELMAGSGYYSDIIARSVGPKGKAWAQNNAFVLQRFAEKNIARRVANPKLSNLQRLDQELDELSLPGNLDAVLMILFYHDTYWQGADRAKMNRSVFEALKPGGIFGIVDHHAEAGSGSRDVQTIHRVDMELVKKEILAAGFILAESSDILRHPEDDRTLNVFKPEIRGKTDRFILKFKKP